MEIIQRRVFISGRVQGVAFRYATRFEAKKYLSIKGFVRNLPDGRVEALFCGPQRTVLALIEWCKEGPSMARVSNVQVINETPDALLGEVFEIRS